MLANMCTASACTIASTCDSSSDPLFESGSQVHIPEIQSNLTCCQGAPASWTCAQLGNFLDTCTADAACHPNPDGVTNNQICVPLDQKQNQWIGVVITLLGAATLNIGLNLQKLALRKRHEKKKLQLREHIANRLNAFRMSLATLSRRPSSPPKADISNDQAVEMTQIPEDQIVRIDDLPTQRDPVVVRHSSGDHSQQSARPSQDLRIETSVMDRASGDQRRETDTPDSVPASPAEVEFQKDLNLKSLLKNPIWILGMIVFILGNLFNFVALQFAAQSLVAPLGSISLVVNVILAPLINHERWTWKDVVGVALIVAGSSMTVAFAGVNTHDYKLCVLLALFRRTQTIVFLTVTCALIVTLYISINTIERNIDFDENSLANSGVATGRRSGETRRTSTSKRLSSWSDKAGGVLSRLKDGVIPGRISVVAAEKEGEEGDGRREEDSDGVRHANLDATTGELNFAESDVPAIVVSKPDVEDPEDHRLGSENGDGTFVGSTSDVHTIAMSDSPLVGGMQVHPTTSEDTINAEPKYELENMDPRLSSAAGRSSYETVDGERRRKNKKRECFGWWRRFKQRNAFMRWLGTVSIWPKFKKKIPLQSVPVRFYLPFAYASLGGLMATITVLCAKATIHLLSTSLFEGDNQYNNGFAWLITGVTVLTAFNQVYWINMGLQRYDALLQIPVFYTVWTLFDVIGGGVYFDEFKGFTSKQYGLFIFAVAVIFVGVGILAGRLKRLEDSGKEPPKIGNGIWTEGGLER
ncbi:hypothetical protein HDV00_000392 [Rhizophlyctis rosea]|nr:hypothetical protein HDV00_000392 [Rhizophlyctis rosea]